MSDPDRDAELELLAESLLNKLHRIGFVKEFIKKPCEDNPDYLDEFESAIVELYEKFTAIVKSAKKRVEDSSQNLREVSDMNPNQEENKNFNSYTADNVQIRVSSEERTINVNFFYYRIPKQRRLE
ncbi:hypothetical protein TNCV_3686291 [Trichonephila clavipes]|nr:hypothetical protein TNCV_3686291 [Trichonephila clavipes]